MGQGFDLLNRSRRREEVSLLINAPGQRETTLLRGQNGLVATHGRWLSSQSSLDLTGSAPYETGPDGYFTYHPGR